MKNIKNFLAKHNIKVALIINIVGAMFGTFAIGAFTIIAGLYGLDIMLGAGIVLAIIAAVWSAINVYTSVED